MGKAESVLDDNSWTTSKKIKKEILPGFRNFDSTNTLEEMAQHFLNMGFVSSVGKGKAMISSLDRYAKNYSLCERINIEKKEDGKYRTYVTFNDHVAEWDGGIIIELLSYGLGVVYDACAKSFKY